MNRKIFDASKLLTQKKKPYAKNDINYMWNILFHIAKPIPLKVVVFCYFLPISFGLSYFNAKCAENAQRAQRIMKSYVFSNFLHNRKLREK
jgi:hypothetical protein